MASRYQDAIDVQNASNPFGVAHLFIELSREFINSPEYRGTGSLRNDPALQLVAYKLFDLMHGGIMDLDRYGTAYNACRMAVEWERDTTNTVETAA
jgi:hypothetical protein